MSPEHQQPDRDILFETTDGPTPNGGVQQTIFYLDDHGDPIDRDKATRARIIEYDVHGKPVGFTYAEIRNV